MEVIKHLKWPPPVINELTFSQIVAMGGGGKGERMEFKTFEEMKPHLDAYLERERPENALHEAEEAFAQHLFMEQLGLG